MRLALGFIKGLQDADDPKAFVTNVITQLGASKIGSNLGLSGMERQGVGSLINMARGKQTLAKLSEVREPLLLSERQLLLYLSLLIRLAV